MCQNENVEKELKSLYVYYKLFIQATQLNEIIFLLW